MHKDSKPKPDSFQFTDMVLERRGEQEAKKDNHKEARMRELRNAMRRLRDEALNANYVMQKIKSTMSRTNGNFSIAYQQSMQEMRSRLAAIRGDMEVMRSALKNTTTLDGDQHDHDHDDHHGELAHMDAETHEIERAACFARGRAGVHILKYDFPEEHSRRHGYTAPIEHDLHMLLHPEDRPFDPTGNDTMKLGRSLDAIVQDFEAAKANIPEETRNHIVDIDASARLGHGESVNRAG
jgi:hypothetical protein